MINNDPQIGLDGPVSAGGWASTPWGVVVGRGLLVGSRVAVAGWGVSEAVAVGIGVGVSVALAVRVGTMVGVVVSQ